MSGRVIIFCGPDRCGKTTILSQLSKLTNIKVYKSSSEHANFLNAQNKFLYESRYADPARFDLIKQLDINVIFDRSYPCEYAYANYYKREYDLLMLKHLDELYSAIDAKIIFCTRKSFYGISDNLDKKLNENALTQISKYYEEFLEQSKCKILKLYVDDEDLDREISEILEFLDK